MEAVKPADGRNSNVPLFCQKCVSALATWPVSVGDSAAFVNDVLELALRAMALDKRNAVGDHRKRCPRTLRIASLSRRPRGKMPNKASTTRGSFDSRRSSDRLSDAPSVYALLVAFWNALCEAAFDHVLLSVSPFTSGAYHAPPIGVARRSANA